MGLIAVGDIHGCAESLAALLDRLAPTRQDQLVFIGDYIDRGPDSKGVIERLIALAAEVPCVFLRGNHEALMLDYLDGGDYEMWRDNGGTATLSSYYNSGSGLEIPPRHEQFIRDTQLYFETPDFLFVHAGLKPYLSVAEQVRRAGEGVFLWERSHLEARHLAWEKPVVCGHTPQQEPLNREMLICIDTGCVYHMHGRYGKLTAVRLPERVFEQVPYQG